MTALSNARNTTEILCHTQKLHRTRTIRDGVKIYTGSIVAISGATNKAEPAADAANLIVIGRAEGFTADGRVIAKSGVFKFDNATDTNEKLTAADINKTVYVIDDHTVGKTGGTNHIPAGVLREIDADSQVVVEIGNHVIAETKTQATA